MPCDNQGGNIGCSPEDGGGIEGPDDGDIIKVIFDPSFENTKAECVYNKLNENSTSFFSIIDEFAGEDSNYDLTFKLADIPDRQENGQTIQTLGQTTTLGNNHFEITINERYLSNLPTLMVAGTLLHEGIHAEMRRKIASVGGQITETNFPGIFDYYTRFGREGDWTHQQMAQHYLNTIVGGLKEFDNNQHSDQFYRSIAWVGLQNTRAWNELSSSDQEELEEDWEVFMSTGNKNCN